MLINNVVAVTPQDLKYNIVAEYIITNRDACYRLAYFYAKDEQAAMDIIQEATIKALRSCHSLRNTEAIRPWFYRIVVNECMRYFRKNKIALYSSEPLPDEVTAQTPMSDTENNAVTSIDLYNAIQKLSPSLQTVVMLRYFEDCKLEEIAQITGANLNTVKSRLHRAIGKLKELYGIEEE